MPTNQPPLLREFIHIPERTSTSDFVLRLSEGVEATEQTLRDYVLTDRLVGNFDEALGTVQSAVQGGSSKAVYLHGSFGAGKSHFMAAPDRGREDRGGRVPAALGDGRAELAAALGALPPSSTASCAGGRGRASVPTRP